MAKKVWHRYIISLCLLLLVVPGMPVHASAPAVSAPAETDSLTDLEGHWAKETITRWIHKGWVHGYSNGTFKPNAPITRAEFVTLVNHAFGFTSAESSLPFTDLPVTSWAYPEVAIAYKAGYFHGASGKANPNQQTVRQEGVVMLANVLRINPAANGDLSPFKDGNLVASWAKGAVAELSARKILKGDGGKFRPTDTLTRAEAVTVIDAALASSQSGGSGSGTSDQTTAYLSDMNLGGELTLVQKGDQGVPAGIGFDKNTNGYTVTLERDMEAVSIPVTVTPESDSAKVEYFVNYMDQAGEQYRKLGTNHAFTIDLKPMEDLHVYITVTSGDGKAKKGYNIDFLYKRNLQETFQVISYPNFNLGDGPHASYSLYSTNLLEQGDVVKLYDSSSRNKLLDTTTVESYGNYMVSLSLMSYSAKYELRTSGNFYIQVSRQGNIFLEGDYGYNLNELNRLTDRTGITVQQLTKQELQDQIKRGGLWKGVAGAVRLTLDPSQWSGVMAEAKYYRVELLDTNQLYQSSVAPLQTVDRGDFDPTGFNVIPVASKGGIYARSTDGNWNVSDAYFQIIFFNGEREPVGYYETTLLPDKEHLADGYTAKHMLDPTLNTGDDIPPVITDMTTITVMVIGNSLGAKLSEKANLYLVPADTELNGRTMHDLVMSGKGRGTVGDTTSSFNIISTSGLPAGDYKLVAVDYSGNVSAPVTIRLV
ncbi:S-layer homology domain-containing protein [Paenibacillus glycanilyticus]|uniref:SLH domain-containing protein n=1 Tax=Paenibacillus glycanilyticus TaxID=126569 RepID=A0ABQ6G5C8_9BACL|nr:S-layer homology domain-containing protein [Paenibacillus glycanilyticus]GLX66166.1 hypothetical protein MU1_05100 [Paenibacillus glycanilyticus]